MQLKKKEKRENNEGRIHLGIASVTGSVGISELVSSHTGNNIVNTEKHTRSLDGGLDRLVLHDERLVDSEVDHIGEFTGLSVDTPAEVVGVGVLGAEGGDLTDGTGTAVLNEGLGDDLHGGGNAAEGPLLDTANILGLFQNSASDGHLGGTTSGEDTGVEDDVTDGGHSVVEVTVDLHEDILGGTTKKDGTGLGVLALLEVGEVLISDLADLKETTSGSDIRVLDLRRLVGDGGTGGTSDTIVIGLADTADTRNAGLDEKVLCQVGHSLLGEDDIGLVGDDIVTDLLNVLLLDSEDGVKIGLVGDFNVGLRLSLLVLQRAIEKENTGVLDLTGHLGVYNILVDHDTIEDAALVEETSGDLLHTSVSLDVNLLLSITTVNSDLENGIQSELGDEVSETRHELGSQTRLDELQNSIGVSEVERESSLLHDFNSGIEGLDVRKDNVTRVHVALEEGVSDLEELSSEDDDGSGTITDLLILGTAELDHTLGSGVRDIDFTKNSVSIVGQNNSTHGVQDHLEHRTRSEGGTDDIRNTLGSLDVAELGLATMLSLCVLVCGSGGRVIGRGVEGLEKQPSMENIVIEIFEKNRQGALAKTSSKG